MDRIHLSGDLQLLFCSITGTSEGTLQLSLVTLTRIVGCWMAGLSKWSSLPVRTSAFVEYYGFHGSLARSLPVNSSHPAAVRWTMSSSRTPIPPRPSSRDCSM